MTHTNQQNDSSRDRKTAVKLLTAVLVLQGLTLAGQWTGQPRVASDARADIPDPGAQRLAMVEEQRQTNAKLDRLIALLESGQVKVQVENDDDDDAGGEK